MTEIAYRMTRRQVNSVASQLAGNGASLAVAKCGAGTATWPSGAKRISWSFRGIEAIIPATEAAVRLQQFTAASYCIFASDITTLTAVAFTRSDMLWACIGPDNELLVYSVQDGILQPVDVCCITDHDLYYRFCGKDPMSTTGEVDADLFQRTMQAFGCGTTHYLSNLTVGVAGVSGTGSIVAEQLMRLGVKRLVLVDDDMVERRNLGRILNSTAKDAEAGTNKAIMMERAYSSIGMGTEVVAAPTVILAPETLHLLSQCDLIFGCLDSTDGRMHLNRISTFYTIPYIDLGVSLVSDQGRITEVSGAIRFILPGESSLCSMNAYTLEQLISDSLRRNDPEAYQARLAEKYIIGAHEGSPAVISVNMAVAAFGVQELLNRLHPFRDTPNDQVEVLTIDMREPAILSPSAPAAPDTALAKYLGRGDCVPLLDLPEMGFAT